MKKYITLSLLLLFHASLSAQIKIIDFKTGNPVAFAHLIMSKGKLGASSDVNGLASLFEIEQKMQNAADTLLTIQHLGYENFEIGLQTLKQQSFIALHERNIPLAEVVITPVKDYDYLVLKGFYRSYHAEDNHLKYYTDGIVEYYIPKNKNKLRFRLLEHRSFRNQEMIDAEKQRAFMVVAILSGIPSIDGKTCPDQLMKDYLFQQVVNGIDIYKKKAKVGYIKIDSLKDICQFNIDKILPEKEVKKSLFNYTGRIQKKELTENYWGDEPFHLTIDNIESHKEYQKMYFGHKKDPREVLLEGTTELYVIEKQYITKKEIKGLKLSSDNSFPKSSSYSYEYWKDLEQYHIPVLSNQIERELGKSLISY